VCSIALILIYISFPNGAEHLFRHSFIIHKSYFEKCLLKSVVQIGRYSFYDSLLWIQDLHYVLWNTFSHSVVYFFFFFAVGPPFIQQWEHTPQWWPTLHAHRERASIHAEARVQPTLVMLLLELQAATCSCFSFFVQLYVHLGVPQSTPIAGYHPMDHLTHRLLCYQINGKVFIHLFLTTYKPNSVSPAPRSPVQPREESATDGRSPLPPLPSYRWPFCGLHFNSANNVWGPKVFLFWLRKSNSAIDSFVVCSTLSLTQGLKEFLYSYENFVF
jgi:hypothetical protein